MISVGEPEPEAGDRALLVKAGASKKKLQGAGTDSPKLIFILKIKRIRNVIKCFLNSRKISYHLENHFYPIQVVWGGGCHI